MATFWWWLAAAAVAAAVIAALLVWLPMRRRRALLEQEAERLALRIQALEQERDEQRRHLEQQGQQWRQTEEKLSVARAEQGTWRDEGRWRHCGGGRQDVIIE